MSSSATGGIVRRVPVTIAPLDITGANDFETCILRKLQDHKLLVRQAGLRQLKQLLNDAATAATTQNDAVADAKQQTGAATVESAQDSKETIATTNLPSDRGMGKMDGPIAVIGAEWEADVSFFADPQAIAAPLAAGMVIIPKEPLKAQPLEQFEQLRKAVFALCCSDKAWEHRHGGFIAAAELTLWSDQTFRDELLRIARKFLEDSEARVRYV
jgi:hypothetical protein